MRLHSPEKRKITALEHSPKHVKNTSSANIDDRLEEVIRKTALSQNNNWPSINSPPSRGNEAPETKKIKMLSECTSDTEKKAKRPKIIMDPEKKDMFGSLSSLDESQVASKEEDRNISMPIKASAPVAVTNNFDFTPTYTVPGHAKYLTHPKPKLVDYKNPVFETAKKWGKIYAGTTHKSVPMSNVKSPKHNTNPRQFPKTIFQPFENKKRTSMKLPLQTFNERVTKDKLKVDFQTLVSGGAHDPIFQVKVTLSNGVFTTGKAKTKKEAKIRACQSAMQKMIRKKFQN